MRTDLVILPGKEQPLHESESSGSFSSAIKSSRQEIMVGWAGVEGVGGGLPVSGSVMAAAAAAAAPFFFGVEAASCLWKSRLR